LNLFKVIYRKDYPFFTPKEVKSQPIEWKGIFAIYVIDRGLDSYPEHINNSFHLLRKKTKISVKRG